MTNLKIWALALLFTHFSAFKLWAQTDTATTDTSTFQFSMDDFFKSYIDSLENTLEFKTGTVLLGNGEATLNIPEGYRFLGPDDAKFILEEQWGNPPEPTLGLLISSGQSPFSPTMTFAIDITYSEDGFVEDDDAEDIDYNELLEDMQDEASDNAPELRKQGYPGYELVGWASPPFYDQQSKKLHWAKELKFDSTEANTLNYNIRVLGRYGYLNLNVIGSMENLPEVQNNIDQILASVEFNDTYRYEDFDSKLDKVAAYGIGGLIAGKVLAKAGFFVILLKFWKFIALGAVGLFAVLKNKIFGGGEK